MASADDQRPGQLRIGGWLPPPGERPARPDEEAATALIPTVGKAAPDRAATASRTTDTGSDNDGRSARSGEPGDPPRAGRRGRGPRHSRQPARRVGPWRGAALVAVLTVAAAIAAPVLLNRSATAPRPDGQLPPPPAVPPTAPPSPADAVVPTASASPGPSASALPGSSAPTRPTPTPSAAPRPTRTTPATRTTPPIRRGFTVSIEAEGPAARRGGRATPRPLPGASGGAVVTGIGEGEDNYVLFPRVTVPATGTYTVTFHHVSSRDRQAAVVVNGRLTVVSFPASGGDWATVGSVSLRLTLRAGTNAIEFRNRWDRAPDLDRIRVTG